ncbi:hypothetical protein [Streptomyces sp. NPDC094472]|uniref:hypothetical protein n=1 Tax=unclassified Streptomyces TaxID=2593676 RepID=UPI00331950EC
MDRLLRSEIPPGGKCDIKTLAREANVDRTAFNGTRPYAHLRIEFERRLQTLRQADDIPDPREAQPCREYLRHRGTRHTIPEKTDSQAARLRKGSRGGRPPSFDEERHKKRNTIERAINKLKHARAVATRYDKRGYVFLGTATAAALVVWLRT